MNKLIRSTSAVIYLSLLSCSSPAQKAKLTYKDLQSISIEHTNPSLGNHEIIKTINLECNKTNLEEISYFLKKIKVNNTVSLLKYLNASKASDTKLINRIFNNSPKKKLNDGGKISNLLFTFKDKSVVELQDVYHQFNLTDFNPEFTSFLMKNGTLTSNNPEFNIPIMKKEYNYADTDLIIKVQLTPGGPGSNSYVLSIFGNGNCNYNNKEKTITKKEIQQILDKSNDVNFISLIKNSPSLQFAHDGQQTNVAIWNGGLLRKGKFGYGNPMPEEVEYLVDFILSKVDNRVVEFKPEVTYSNTDLIIKLVRTVGGPGSTSYQLSIFGDGSYKYNNTSVYALDHKPSKNYKAKFDKEEIQRFLSLAKKLNFSEIIKSQPPLPFVHDGQQSHLSIWNNGRLETGEFGYGYPIPKELQESIDYILSVTR